MFHQFIALNAAKPVFGRALPLLKLWNFAYIRGSTQPSVVVAFYYHHHAEEFSEDFSDMQGLGVSDVSSDNAPCDAFDVSSNCLARALQECRNFSHTGLIHHLVVKNGVERLTLLANHLVRAYDTSGSLLDARKVFDSMAHRNLLTWNIMIAAHAHHRDGNEAVLLIHNMYLQGFSPSDATYISVLRACTSSKLLEDAKLVHALIVVDSGFVSCNVENAIFSMYSKCGGLKDALNIFERMQAHNEVSWNALISAFAHDGGFPDAFQHFRQMVLEGGNPGRATYMTLLNALDETSGLELGRTIHVQFMSSNLESDVVLDTAFLNMYRKYSSVTDARTLFDGLSQRNLVTWNVMIAAYAQHGHPQEALALFAQMKPQKVRPDGITFVTILNTCSSPFALSNGEVIYDSIIKNGLESDGLVGSSLVSMYGKCGSLPEARVLLDRLPDNNLVAWNAMLSAYAQQEYAHEAIELLEEMRLRGTMPDRVTFISVVCACSKASTIEHGIRVHISIMATSFNQNTAVVNALITMYSKCKEVGYARKAFEAMYLHDLISWNALIVGYAQHEDVEEILRILCGMHKSGFKPTKATFVSALDACCTSAALVGGQLMHYQVIDLGFETDVMVGTALVTMYGKCNNLESARRVFNNLPKHDVVSWSAMIAMYGRQGCGKEAFEVFQEMACGGLLPNRVTFVSVLDACASVAALPEGKLVHSCFMESGLELDMVVGNAFVSMYGKCGSLENARDMFTRMREKDVVSWSALIAAFAQHGHGKEAVNIFCEMGRNCVRPDSITFVSVLSACSHAGMIDEGCSYFDSMEEDYGIIATEDHCVCMMDLFGRIGRLAEAEKYLMKIPGKPGIVAWMTLLSASRLHNDLERGQYAAERVLELDPQNDAVYIILSNILSAAGKWQDAVRLRKVMAQRGIKKSLGWSSITLDGKVHEFSARETLHPQIREIEAELEKLTVEIKEMGYVPDAKIVLHDVSDEEKERLLCHHSERLAIALGLISTCHGSPLHIIKNLRVCGDCHTATKYISKLRRRAIIVRDANRFHHFKEGICSCGDYW
ncbi:hypothetical protein L7F22_061032 [Adiantum nelumboides]|nr:hypothetical protein [Adiantum nelumboides]